MFSFNMFYNFCLLQLIIFSHKLDLDFGFKCSLCMMIAGPPSYLEEAYRQTPEVFPLGELPGHPLGRQVHDLDAQQGGVDDEVPGLVPHHVVELCLAHPPDLLLHRHLLAKLHGRQDLLHLDGSSSSSIFFFNRFTYLTCRAVLLQIKSLR